MLNITEKGIKDKLIGVDFSRYDYVYGIPKNGAIIAAQYIPLRVLFSLKELLKQLLLGRNVLIVDDVRDSGRTQKKLLDYVYPYEPDFLFIVDKLKEGITDWIHFEWEDFESLKDEVDDQLRMSQKKENKTSKEWAEYYERACIVKSERLKHLISLATQHQGSASELTSPFPGRNVNLRALAYENTGGYGRCVAYYMEKLGKITPIKIKKNKSQPTLI